MNTSDRVHPRKTFRVLVSPFASFQLPALNILTFHSGLLLKFIWTCSSSFSSHCDTAPLMLRSFKGSNSPTVFGLFTPLRFIHSPSCHIRTEKREIHFVRSLSHYKHFFLPSMKICKCASAVNLINCTTAFLWPCFFCACTCMWPWPCHWHK